MEIYLVRHGQSTNNAGMPRVPDPPLTALGQEQARRAGRALAGFPLVALYASPMRRAIQTAFHIAETLPLPPRLLPDLCEVGGVGELAGMCRADILAEWPDAVLPESITDKGWWTPAPEDSDETLVYSRAARALSALRERHAEAEEAIAVVTHGTFGSALLSVLLGLPPAGCDRFEFDNCGITRVSLETCPLNQESPASSEAALPSEIARILSHNRTAHLPPNIEMTEREEKARHDVCTLSGQNIK